MQSVAAKIMHFVDFAAARPSLEGLHAIKVGHNLWANPAHHGFGPG